MLISRRRGGKSVSKHGGWRLWARLSLVLALLFSIGHTAAYAKDPITLRFVVFEGDEGLTAMRKLLLRFESENPGVKVHLENADYASYFQKLLAQFAANVAPDVARMDVPNFQRFAKRGALTPLNGFFGDTPGFDIHAYYKKIVDAHSYKGQVFVLPSDIAPMGIVYFNKRAFREAGIPYPDGSWTWDFDERPELREKDFLWVAHHLMKQDASGKTVRYGVLPAWPGILTDVFADSQGLQIVDNPEAPTRLFLTDPRYIRTYQFVSNIYQKRHWCLNPTELSSVMSATADQMFTRGQTAMYICGIWSVKGIREDMKKGATNPFDWDITLTPAYAHGKRGMPTGGSGYAMLSSTAHPKEAWKLIEFMAGKPGMDMQAELGSAQPAIRALARSAPWIPADPAHSEDPPSRLVTDEAVDSVVFGPTADYWQEIQQIISNRTDSIWTGVLPADEALGLAQKEATQRLNAVLADKQAPPFNWGAGIAIALGITIGLIGWVYLPGRRTARTSAIAKAENRWGYFFLAPWIAGTLLFALGPMLVSLLISFADWDIITPAKFRGIGNYQEAFRSDPAFYKTLTVTFTYTFISVPLGILFSLCLALLLNLKVRGMAIFRTCFYMPALASTVASTLIWRKVFQQDGGLLNAMVYGSSGKGNLLGIGSLVAHYTGKVEPANWLGNEKLIMPSLIIMSVWGVGAGMIILLAGLQGIPQFYYEAAILDGAGSWAKFKAVTLPMLAPSLLFVMITSVIGGLQIFTQVFVLTKGMSNEATRTFMYHLYDEAFVNLRMGYAAALAWLLFFIIMAFTLVQLRLNKNVYYEADLK